MVSNLLNHVHHATVDLAWSQWTALGAMGGEVKATAMVDPEALVLLSLSAMEQERRLEDFLVWWAKEGARFTSVQRMKSLASLFPPSTQAALSEWAGWALSFGDKRWSSLAGTPSPPRANRSSKGIDRPSFSEASALWLRLRVGFGVSVKSDVLAQLLSHTDTVFSVKDLADALGYTDVAIRSAVADLVQTQWVAAKGTRPLQVFVRAEPWRPLLQVDELPKGRPLAAISALLVHLAVELRKNAHLTAYLQASRVRDVVEAHHPQIAPHAPALPSHGMGEAYLDGVMGWVGGVVG